MEWYLKVVRDNYANFEGRARRSEYWYFILFHVIILIILATTSILVGEFFMIVYALYALATLIPYFAVVVRRLHDIGKSGWFFFVSLIPFIGGIWLLILLFTEGDNGPNEYGEDPKRPYEDLEEIGTKQY